MRRGDHRDDLRDERQRLFLDLRHRLEQRDDDADDQADEQHRRGDDQREHERVANEVSGLVE